MADNENLSWENFEKRNGIDSWENPFRDQEPEEVIVYGSETE